MIERIGGAGTGGAGLLTCLKTLSYAAAARGWHVAYTSDYNPETRGGLVQGTLVVSDEQAIDNPVVESYTAVLAFDYDGYRTCGRVLEPDGLIVWDSSRIHTPPELPGARSYGIPIHEMAAKAGAARLANMAMLGFYNRIRGVFSIDELIGAMQTYLPVWRHKWIPANRAILDAVAAIDPEQYRRS
jgi:Pyruvate/2-oxoacid:ferredoxin oxidoreductase gamma subunit